MDPQPRVDATTEPVIPDRFLRQIIDVGQVDLLVAVATGDDAAETGHTVAAVRTAFRTFYSRLRTALVIVDRRPGDGAALSARHAWSAAARDVSDAGLRTAHLVECDAGWMNDGDTARVVLAAADLLQARAVEYLGDEVALDGPGEVASLARPLLDGDADLTVIAAPRRLSEGLLVTQVVRPLTEALFVTEVVEPLLPTFACSSAFATAATQRSWDLSALQRATRFWVAAEALVSGSRLRALSIGGHRRASPAPPSLLDVFPPVVSSVFACLEASAGAWLEQRHDAAHETSAPTVAATIGSPATAGPAALHRDDWRASFAEDLGNLREIYAQLLAGPTWTRLRAAVGASNTFSYTHDLWAATLADVLVAFHHNTMQRDHVVQALLPLYRARVHSFLEAHGHESPAEAAGVLAALTASMRQERHGIVGRWHSQREGHHG